MYFQSLTLLVYRSHPCKFEKIFNWLRRTPHFDGTDNFPAFRQFLKHTLADHPLLPFLCGPHATPAECYWALPLFEEIYYEAADHPHCVDAGLGVDNFQRIHSIYTTHVSAAADQNAFLVRRVVTPPGSNAP